MKKNKKHKSKVLKKLHKNNYSARSLAVILMLVIFFDGMLFGAVGSQDIKAGLELLDMSSSFSTTASDLSMLVAPLIAQAKSVHQFYMMASDEVIFLLDNNLVANIGSLFQDVLQFYKVATEEMSDALDLSEELTPTSVYASAY